MSKRSIDLQRQTGTCSAVKRDGTTETADALRVLRDREKATKQLLAAIHANWTVMATEENGIFYGCMASSVTTWKNGRSMSSIRPAQSAKAARSPQSCAIMPPSSGPTAANPFPRKR